MKQEEQQSVCRSVFKDGGTVACADRVTKAWIDWINRLEKNKQILNARI